MLKYLQTAFSLTQSVIISSVFFGLVHFNGGIYKMIIVAIQGLLWSYIYLKYNSLIIPILLHLLNNMYNILAYNISSFKILIAHYNMSIFKVNIILFILTGFLLVYLDATQRKWEPEKMKLG